MATLKSASQAESRNELLAGLAPADFRLLEVDLTRVELQVPKQMESPNKRISHVYFIERGIASVVGNGTGRPMEIGLIGREDMTGLASWLLMARDRIDTDELFLTHEFLSIMLGVRRASITETLRGLAEDDLIAIKRSTIAIVDRVRLQKRANGDYVPPKRD